MTERDEKIKILLAVQEKDRRKRAAPLIYYRPHGGQERAHQAMRRKRIVIVVAGNRYGKSHWAAAETVAHCYGYRPWEVPDLTLTSDGDYPPRHHVPPEYWIRRADGVPLTLPAAHACVTGLGLIHGINRTMWPKIESMLPPGVLSSQQYQVRRGAFSVPVEVLLPNGSRIFFASGEQSPMSYEAQAFTSAGIDEPTKRSIFGALWRGLTDSFGPLFMSMTPLGPNAPWVYEEFEEGRREDTEVVAGSIWDNPFITDLAKREFLDGGGFTEEERSARETGAWTFLSHRAFPSFDPSVHVISRQAPLPRGWISGLACDPAHRRPFMLVWALFGPHGEMLPYDEWPESDHHQLRSSEFTIRDYAPLIRQREAAAGIVPSFRVMDPRFGAARPMIKGIRFTTIQEDFANEGLYFDCNLEGTEREEVGIHMLRELMRYDRRSPLSPLNAPRLRVRDNCINVINSLRLSNFKSPSLMDPDKLDEVLTEKYKDARDCMRYLAVAPKLLPGTRPTTYLAPDALREYNDPEAW